MPTRDQRYAAAIYKQISTGVVGKGKDYSDAYGSMAHKLPVLIRSAGLAQALAFVESRGKDAHRDLLDHLAEVVLGEGNNRSGLSEQSRETTQLSAYMYLTSEAVAALVWYKRFAQSVLEVDASAEGSEPSE